MPERRRGRSRRWWLLRRWVRGFFTLPMFYGPPERYLHALGFCQYPKACHEEGWEEFADA